MLFAPTALALIAAGEKPDTVQGVSLHTLLYGQAGLPHRHGFTEQTMSQALQRAGFEGVRCFSESLELWATATRPKAAAAAEVGGRERPRRESDDDNHADRAGGPGALEGEEERAEL